MIIKPICGFVKFPGGFVKLPDECFICSSSKNNYFTLYRLYDFQYKVFYYSYRRMVISAPVCKKHYWQLQTMRFLIWTLPIGIPIIFSILNEVGIGYSGDYSGLIGLGIVAYIFLF